MPVPMSRYWTTPISASSATARWMNWRLCRAVVRGAVVDDQNLELFELETATGTNPLKSAECRDQLVNELVESLGFIPRGNDDRESHAQTAAVRAQASRPKLGRSGGPDDRSCRTGRPVAP